MGTRIWVPASLRRRSDLASLAYVVIDELESNMVGLTVSPWPTMDSKGRLHYDLERSRAIGARSQALRAFLTKHRTPRKIASRPLRMGDTFAFRIKGSLADGELMEPGSWMIPPITDISAEAREAAKLAYFSAVAPVLHRRVDREIVELAPKSAPLGSVPIRSTPDPYKRQP